MICVVTEDNMRCRLRRSKLNFRPLVLAMPIAVNIFPCLGGREAEAVSIEADNRAVVLMVSPHAKVEGAFALLYVAEDGEGDPRAWARIVAERVKVKVIEG